MACKTPTYIDPELHARVQAYLVEHPPIVRYITEAELLALVNPDAVCSCVPSCDNEPQPISHKSVLLGND